MPITSIAIAALVALSGTVTSNEEGPMEGVLVSAQRSGSPITITVVSDAKGGYRFPEDKLAAGRYAIRIRAAGYDLESPREAQVGSATQGALDLRLRKTRTSPRSSPTPSGWSACPARRRRSQLLNCLGCHTPRARRAVEVHIGGVPHHGPADAGLMNQSIPGAPQLRKGERLMEERGDQRVHTRSWGFPREGHLSGSPTWRYELKTFAPHGRGDARRLHGIRPAGQAHAAPLT
jgi:hypothetical protein